MAFQKNYKTGGIGEMLHGRLGYEQNRKLDNSIKSWRDNWESLTGILEFPLEIRRSFFITNLFENIEWKKIRKHTEKKMSFPTDEAVMKLVYLVTKKATK